MPPASAPEGGAWLASPTRPPRDAASHSRRASRPRRRRAETLRLLIYPNRATLRVYSRAGRPGLAAGRTATQARLRHGNRIQDLIQIVLPKRRSLQRHLPDRAAAAGSLLGDLSLLVVADNGG